MSRGSYVWRGFCLRGVCLRGFCPEGVLSVLQIEATHILRQLVYRHNQCFAHMMTGRPVLGSIVIANYTTVITDSKSISTEVKAKIYCLLC